MKQVMKNVIFHTSYILVSQYLGPRPGSDWHCVRWHHNCSDFSCVNIHSMIIMTDGRAAYFPLG